MPRSSRHPDDGDAANRGHVSASLTTVISAIADPLICGYVTFHPSTEPWKNMLAENCAGSQPITMTIFVGQGSADELVKPKATADYVTLPCSQQTNVDFHCYHGLNHVFAAYAALPDMLGWLTAVTSGKTLKSTCP